MNVYIITGTSKGLGLALTKRLLLDNNHLFCISRSTNTDLAKEGNSKATFIEFDLSKVYEIDKLMNSIFDEINMSEIRAITLINNAGTLSPMAPIESCKDVEIISNIHLNLLAPMLLSSAFVRHTQNFGGHKRIVNISSGAGKNPYHGWSNYCTSKAGLDLFTRCVGLEQEQHNNPTRIFSIAPSVMDTDMQAQIRMSEKDNFQSVDRFIEMKEKGRLLSPDFVAEKLVTLLESDEYPQGGVIDIRDYTS